MSRAKGSLTALALVLAFAGSSRIQADSVAPRTAGRGRTRGEFLRMLEKDPARKEIGLIPVRHLGRNEQGRQIAESPNFRVVHNQNKALVERVARAAERLRPALQRQWFGDVSLDWDGKCVIFLHDSHKKYVDKTKQWNALGHARTVLFGEQVSSRSIHLPCGLSNFFDDLLPHELTHAVLAVRFRGRLPRWANEGIAMLSESRASIDERHESLAEYRKKDDLFSVEILMKTDEDNQMNTLEYYAQSMSLVEFFVAERGRPAFSKFLGDSPVVGYGAALKTHYGINSFAELERRWLAFAFTNGVQPPGGWTRLDVRAKSSR